MKRSIAPLLLMCVALLSFTFGLSGCIKPKINLFPDYSEPLREYTLESGEGEGKVLLLPISGVISARSQRGFFSSRPSTAQEVKAALDMAREDKDIRAIVLQIDSPGGSATASDMVYNEIVRYREATGVKVIATMMDLAASGGYYVAMGAEKVYAHPTTVTGSIGVIFFTVSIDGLFKKIGVRAEPVKSGTHKDMGSPFREMTDDERAIFQGMIDEMYTRFVNVVDEGRKDLDEAQVRKLADGRIYTAQQALDAKLIDGIAYLPDVIADAKSIAGLNQDAPVVVYRRNEFGNDNVYNTSTASADGDGRLFKLAVDDYLFTPSTGFYYIWEPGLGGMQ